MLQLRLLPQLADDDFQRLRKQVPPDAALLLRLLLFLPRLEFLLVLCEFHAVLHQRGLCGLHRIAAGCHRTADALHGIHDGQLRRLRRVFLRRFHLRGRACVDVRVFRINEPDQRVDKRTDQIDLNLKPGVTTGVSTIPRVPLADFLVEVSGFLNRFQQLRDLLAFPLFLVRIHAAVIPILRHALHLVILHVHSLSLRQV